MTKLTINPISAEEFERRLAAVQEADEIAFMDALMNDGEPPVDVHWSDIVWPMDGAE